MEGAVLDWLAMLSVRESLMYGPAQRAVGGEEEEEERRRWGEETRTTADSCGVSSVSLHAPHTTEEYHSCLSILW